MENFNDSKALAIEIAKILDKKKAHDVRVLKVESLTVLTDYFVIASGTSTTQVAALADEVEFELSQKGLEPYSTEGYDSKNWVLLDYSNVIVHVFVPNTRTYYDLEHLWADGEPIDISEYPRQHRRVISSRQTGSPSPSLLRNATSPKGRGKGCTAAFLALPFEERLPPVGGRCRISDKKGNLSPKVTERARMQESKDPEKHKSFQLRYFANEKSGADYKHEVRLQGC